jgi:hypothetical protein
VGAPSFPYTVVLLFWGYLPFAWVREKFRRRPVKDCDVPWYHPLWLRYWWYRLTARLRHGRQCETCDRRAICQIIKAGSRPCDRDYYRRKA